METVQRIDRKERQTIQHDITQPDRSIQLLISRGQREDQPGQQVTVHDDHMQKFARRADRCIEGMRSRFDKRKKQPQQPDVRLLLRMPPVQHRQNDDQNR